jgi:hypothetical protein
MDNTLELAAAGAIASELTTPSPAVPSHTHAICLNCGARLHGPFCHDCGQSGDDHHRSIGHLLWEAVEGFTHLDGRLAQTLPALLFHPGRLARDHIEGRRQRHVPPFRLFLICLLVFMFAAEAMLGHVQPIHVQTRLTSPASRQAYQAGLKQALQDPDMAEVKTELHGAQPDVAVARWWTTHIARAAGNREYFLMLVFEWAHRLAVLLLPILAGLMTLCYVYKPRFYIYDHLVVSMQYLSFCFLVWAAVWIIPDPVQGWLFWPALIWTPLNLYLILRRAYGSRRIGAAAKALLLWLTTVASFGALLAGLLGYALNTV